MGSHDPDLDDDEYDYAPEPDGGGDDPPLDDCLGCGQCEWCIERSIAAAEEYDREGGRPDA